MCGVRNMSFTTSEILFYGGIALVSFAVFFALACIIIFKITGQKLKKTLEQEYGKDVQNNSRDL